MPVYNTCGFWKDSSLSMALWPEAAAPRVASSGYYTEKSGHTVDPRLHINPWAVYQDGEIADPSVKSVGNGSGEFSLTFVPSSVRDHSHSEGAIGRGASDSESEYFDDDLKPSHIRRRRTYGRQWIHSPRIVIQVQPTVAHDAAAFSVDGDDIANDFGNNTSLTSIRYPFSVDTHPRVGALSDATRSPSSTRYPRTRQQSPALYDGGIEDGLDRLRLDEYPDFDPLDDPFLFVTMISRILSHRKPDLVIRTTPISSPVTMSAAHLPVVGYLSSYISAPAQKTNFASSSLLHALSPNPMCARSAPRDDGGVFLVERERTSARTRASSQSRKAPKASRGVDAAVVQNRRMRPVLFHCTNCSAAGKACDFTSKYSLNRHINSTTAASLHSATTQAVK
ncbi:hypothetical protein CPB85DRAFT_1507277 [Mucidula mucida]|nr:hypothetical protein CPB85DRAFT_1507277 [Mucidula mucida]